jgi:hypothetical protein
MQRNFIESLIGSAKAKLLQLRDALKEIDEGG